ncbi:hypothetical protein ABZ924_30500 [Streptomyces sp. NPDC046876]|uniref:hypothetical protein n=1 Tax=Streptomyces sp. NPDC046876 TaxID=3155616 RepID=UPI0033D2D0B5
MNLAAAGMPHIRVEADALLAVFPSQQLLEVSCHAEGADSLFAEAVLAAGGRLVAVIPSPDYRARRVSPARACLRQAARAAGRSVRDAPFETAHRDAYEAATTCLLDSADELVAIWTAVPPPAGAEAPPTP